MRKKHRIFTKWILLAAMICAMISLSASAHSGRTDSDGGHTVTSTGEYHWHHGYPAHQHEDLDGDGIYEYCPYSFVDATDHSSGSSNSNSGNTASDKPEVITKEVVVEKAYVPEWILWTIVSMVIVIITLFVLLRKKSNEVQHERRKSESYRKEYRESIGKKLTEFDNDLKKAYGDRYLYEISGAKPSDYLDDHDLPCDDYGTYIFYRANLSQYENTRIRFHCRLCRYTNLRNPINAYTLSREKYKYIACQICRPDLPDVSWVDRYKVYRDFLEENRDCASESKKK